MKTLGAVAFICLLLMIAGVETNPGPTDKFLFRYLYLLIEIGSMLLRKLFDDTVKNNLVQYLQTNPNCSKQLVNLTQNNILTDGQKDLLPPKEQNPDSTKFDITLLTCLLRNICGLASPKDPVWKAPANNDTSVEAEITRLRQCRNEIQHMSTVYISETEFQRLWDKLCDILKRLNKYCGIPDLKKMIDDALTKPLDDQLHQQYDKILKQWQELDSIFEKGIEFLKIGQSELRDDVSELKDGQTKLLAFLQDKELCSQTTTKGYEAMRDVLKYNYENNFRTMCVTPLDNEDDHMEILKLYARPKMNHVPYHQTRENEGNYIISSYEQVFCKDKFVFRNIFVTGDAGIGKTSFGQLMSLLWCKAISDAKVDKKEMQKDSRFMTKFDLVFYLSLKETRSCYEDVVSMIVDRYFYTSSKDKFEETIKNIEHIFQSNDYECLIILDGLDEWRPDINGKGKLTLPRKVTSQRCTYLTLCRPHIIETVRLSKMDIDHQVQITGFDFEKYIRDLVEYINKLQHTSKDPDEFCRQIKKCEMYDQLNVPVIASQLVYVWLKHELHNMTKALIYATTVDMLLKRAESKLDVTFPLVTLTDVKLPGSFSGLTCLQKYISTLEKVCLLSFLLLFDPNNKSPCLVVTKEQLMAKPYCISQDEVKFLCQLGIISKSKVIAPFNEKEQKLSFIHQSYLEFLAALFVSFFDKTWLFNKPSLISIKDTSRYKNFLILLAGISPESVKLFFYNIYIGRKDVLDFERREILFCPSFPTDGMWVLSVIRSALYAIQNVARSCLKELSLTDSHTRIKLQDIFLLGKFDLIYKTNYKHLTELVAMNKSKVKFLAVLEQYRDEFASIKGLEYLFLENLNDAEIGRFFVVMVNNQSTLHSIRINICPLNVSLPVRSLPHLTTIYLFLATVEYTVFQDLLNYISSNIQLECIVLINVKLKGGLHEIRTPLNLSRHSKLHTLGLTWHIPVWNRINTSSLKSLDLDLIPDGVYADDITQYYSFNVLISLIESELECLHIDGMFNSHPQAINSALCVMRTLHHLSDLKLRYISMPSSASLLKLFTGTRSDSTIKIKLDCVRMRDALFRGFIDDIINSQHRFKLHIMQCILLLIT